MSRLIPGTVSVILFGCVAVALLASDEAPSSGSLRSVLKRNAAPSAVPAPAATVPAPSVPPAPARAAVAPAASAPAAPAATGLAPAKLEDAPAASTGSKPAPFSAERNPAGTSDAAEGPLTGPQSSAAPRLPGRRNVESASFLQAHSASANSEQHAQWRSGQAGAHATRRSCSTH